MKKICTALTLLTASSLIGDDIAWTTPATQLSTSGVNASDPQIATDSSGNLVSVWVESGFVKAKTRPHNGSWSTAVTLSATGASVPRVVSDLNGNATAIWVEGTIVKASSRPSGGSWSTASTLSQTGAASPEIGVDSSGNVVAVWARNGSIESSTKLFGGNWSTKVTITSSAAALPTVAVNGSRAVAVWHGTSGTNTVVFASSKLLSGNWSTQQVISDTTHQAAYAHVAVDSSGNATAVWYQYDVTSNIYSHVNVQTAYRSNASGLWNTPTALSEEGMRNPATLAARVAYDATGNAIALWNISFDDETYNIQSAMMPLRGEWTAPTDLVTGSLYSYYNDLAVSSLGDALAFYMFHNGNTILMQSSESNISGFMENLWSVPINVTQNTNTSQPDVAATLTGNAINAAAVWISYNGSNNLVLATTGTRNVVLPPSSPAVTQSSNNFGVFTEYYNTVSWSASTDPKLAGYLVYRNGTLIRQVDANTLQIVDDNRVQSGAVTYGVAAINGDSSESQIVTVNYP